MGNQCSEVAMSVLITSHRGQQYIERVGIIMSYPVDEEGWCAAYPAMPPAFDILVHPMRKTWFCTSHLKRSVSSPKTAA